MNNNNNNMSASVRMHIVGRHSGAVIKSAASHRQGSEFKRASRPGPLCVDFECSPPACMTVA